MRGEVSHGVERWNALLWEELRLSKMDKGGAGEQRSASKCSAAHTHDTSIEMHHTSAAHNFSCTPILIPDARGISLPVSVCTTHIYSYMYIFPFCSVHVICSETDGRMGG